MKKFFLPVLAIVTITISTSCGASKHRCPAYGSNEQIDDLPSDKMTDFYMNSEQKG